MNVRLTAQILNVKTVDVKKSTPEPTVEELYHNAIDDLAELPGIERDEAQSLVDAGYLSIEGILDPANDFRNAAAEDGNFDQAFVEKVWEAAQAWQAAHPQAIPAPAEEPAPADDAAPAETADATDEPGA